MYGLAPADDRTLTAWMHAHLLVAVWPAPVGVVLREVETEVFRQLQPPLNLISVQTRWTQQVKAARRVMVASIILANCFVP